MHLTFKGGTTINYAELIHRKEHLLKKKNFLLNEVSKLPDGSISYCRNKGTYIDWFYLKNGTRKYLQKSQKELAKALALKKYYELMLHEISEEIAFIETYQKKLSSTLPREKSTDLLTDSSPYYPLLQSYFAKDKLPVSAQNWCAESYETNHSHPEHLIHTTLAGHKVRSKSEVIIANLLYTNHIPYRYEAALPLKEFTAYPDFTIMHPVTNKIFYWEHFGMMDNAPYCDTACNKLKTYCYNGIFPSMQLITTYETSKCPISTDQVQQIITQYFL
jgi:hypothetical protein